MVPTAAVEDVFAYKHCLLAAPVLQRRLYVVVGRYVGLVRVYRERARRLSFCFDSSGVVSLDLALRASAVPLLAGCPGPGHVFVGWGEQAEN